MKNGLPAGYEIREMSGEEFQPLWKKHAAAIFDAEGPIFRLYPNLTEEEKLPIDARWKKAGEDFQIRLGVFCKNEFVGWHTGNQETPFSFYMRNSAVLPEHRRKGLYSALIHEVMDRVLAQGFQQITSKHNADNNAVIVPKLKAGFVITGLSVDDMFGTLVTLTYYPKELRRKILAWRTGRLHADDEVARVLGLKSK